MAPGSCSASLTLALGASSPSPARPERPGPESGHTWGHLSEARITRRIHGAGAGQGAPEPHERSEARRRGPQARRHWMSSRGSRLRTERGVQEAVIASEVRGAPADSVQRAHSGASPVLLGMGAHRFWLPRHAMSAWRTGAFNRHSAVRKTGGIGLPRIKLGYHPITNDNPRKQKRRDNAPPSRFRGYYSISASHHTCQVLKIRRLARMTSA